MTNFNCERCGAPNYVNPPNESGSWGCLFLIFLAGVFVGALTLGLVLS